MLTSEQRTFLHLVAGPALESERLFHVPAAVTIAQAILESGWGRSKLFTEAHNPFGIKRQQNRENYGEFDARTLEYAGGQPHAEVDAFEKFPSLAVAFRAHGLLLSSSPRYAEALDEAEHPARFAVALQHCGYATDPAYARKLWDLILAYKLDDPARLKELAEVPGGVGVRNLEL